jgi:hypothetical protein
LAAPPDCAYYFIMMLNGGWLAHSSRVQGSKAKTLPMRYLAAILMFLFLALADPAAAQRFPPPGGGGGQISLNEIVNAIRSRYPGQLSDVQDLGGRYRVKWLTPDGRVMWIEADARTGQILGVEGGGGAGGGGGGRGPGFGQPDEFGPGPGRARGRNRDR